MLHDFEAELEGLTDSITQDQQELDRISRETVNAEKFLALVKKYTDFSELTPAMINEFVEKILVHQAEGKGASRTQEVEIFFNFVCKVEIPHEEIVLTEEEKAAAPFGFVTADAKGKGLEGLQYRMQISPLDCLGCGNCADI